MSRYEVAAEEPRLAVPEAKSGRVPVGPLRTLVPYVMRYRTRLIMALAALTIASLATLILPLAVRRMIDYGFGAEGESLIDLYFGVLMGVVGVLAVASAARYYLVTWLGERVVSDLRAEVFSHLTRLSPAFYDRSHSGEVMSRLTADATQIKAAVGASMSIALRNLFLGVGAATMMVVTSPRLSAYVLIVIPVIVLPLVAFGRQVRKRSRHAQDTLADASAFASEQVGAVRTMQSFTAEEVSSRRYSSAVERAFAAARSSTASRAILTAIALFLIFGSVVLVLWSGAQEVLAGTMSPGRLGQFVLYSAFAAGALGELSQVWGEVQAAAGAAGRLSELLETKPEVKKPTKADELPLPVVGALNFDHVGFAYPSRKDEPVLGDLNFSVAPGERVALVGPSGAGKSTVLQLIMRFYDPDSGSITLDRMDISKLDPQALRSQLSLVPQDPVVFAASVRENISYGQPNVSDDAIQRAARLARADGFINAMAQGYDTQLGERGVMLSGGQRQRIAIARAILKNAPILLLDEATSALDAESEKLVTEALTELMKGRTTIVIAHRLATILHCDRILVLDGGDVVEQGTHSDLSAAGGLYSRLAKLQFTAG